MGLKTAAIFIKHQEPKRFLVEDIIKAIFGENFKIAKTTKSGFDFRKPKYVVISYQKSGVLIYNGEIVNQVLLERNREVINKIYQFFEQPKTILTFMHYDSGDSYGFSYIEKGEIKRFRYSTSIDYITYDYGNPLDEELNILGGQILFDTDEYGERHYLYTQYDVPEKLNDYNALNSDLTNAVMIAKMGYGLYSENQDLENVYVTLALASEPSSKEKSPSSKKRFLNKLFGK